jgi:hypothetical protein
MEQILIAVSSPAGYGRDTVEQAYSDHLPSFKLNLKMVPEDF